LNEEKKQREKEGATGLSEPEEYTDQQREWLAERFEAERPHLHAVAYRMLGSLSEADDAVQESWLRLSRSDTTEVLNLSGWLTTVIARICLDMLRERDSRREESLETSLSEPIATHKREGDPEQEMLLADSVGLARLVVLDMLAPAERLAFVLHDIFAMPFDEIAPIVERSETATRQLASRARRRVRGATTVKNPDLTRKREVADAFLAASREDSFDALLAVLDPDVVLRADRTAASAGRPEEVRGAPLVARQFFRRAYGARSVLVNGALGLVVAWRGRLFLVMELTIRNDKIVEINVVADPARLHQLGWI
jgi:RNA polymerase sigma factor (sigma-70 family)